MNLLKNIAGAVGFLFLFFLGKAIFDSKKSKPNPKGRKQFNEKDHWYDYDPYSEEQEDAVNFTKEILRKESKI